MDIAKLVGERAPPTSTPTPTPTSEVYATPPQHNIAASVSLRSLRVGALQFFFLSLSLSLKEEDRNGHGNA